MQNKPQERHEGQQVPDFMKGDEAKGYDDVDDDVNFHELRVCTPLSDVADEIPVGNIYNYDTGEDLGEELLIIVFAKRKRFMLSNDDNRAILCKSYDRKEGNIRTYHDVSMFDEEALEGLGVSKEEIEESEQTINRDCDTCPHHPIKGWETNEDGENVPPRCSLSHEYYVHNFSGEQIDNQPYIIRLPETSRLKQDIVESFDELITQKLRHNRIPIFGGVFIMNMQKMENQRGKAVEMPNFEFKGILGQDIPEDQEARKRAHMEAYELAKTSSEEFEKYEENIAEQQEKQNAQESTTSESPQGSAPSEEDFDTEEGDGFDTPWEV